MTNFVRGTPSKRRMEGQEAAAHPGRHKADRGGRGGACA